MTFYSRSPVVEIHMCVFSLDLVYARLPSVFLFTVMTVLFILETQEKRINSFQILTNINSDSTRIAWANTCKRIICIMHVSSCVMHLFLKWIIEDLVWCVHPPVLQNSIGILADPANAAWATYPGVLASSLGTLSVTGRWWRLSRLATLERLEKALFSSSNVASSCIFVEEFLRITVILVDKLWFCYI